MTLFTPTSVHTPTLHSFPHDALPISHPCQKHPSTKTAMRARDRTMSGVPGRSRRWMRNLSPREWSVRRSASSSLVEDRGMRSEEHTSELQSRFDLVCRLLLEKKKKTN